MRIVLVKHVYRTGVTSVELEDGRYFLKLANRTVDVEHEVPFETAMRYRQKIMRDKVRGRR